MNNVNMAININNKSHTEFSATKFQLLHYEKMVCIQTKMK